MKSASVSYSERETVITWTDADGGVAVVYTSQPPMMGRLRKHPHAKLLTTHRSGRTVMAEEYELPVACLAILLKPRSTDWDGMVQTGRGGRKIPAAGARYRLDGSDPAQNTQTDLSGVCPEGSQPSAKSLHQDAAVES